MQIEKWMNKWMNKYYVFCYTTQIQIKLLYNKLRSLNRKKQRNLIRIASGWTDIFLKFNLLLIRIASGWTDIFLKFNLLLSAFPYLDLWSPQFQLWLPLRRKSAKEKYQSPVNFKFPRTISLISLSLLHLILQSRNGQKSDGLIAH